jgi:hypothetical protein
MAGAPEGTTLAPPLVGTPRLLGHRDYIIKVLLHGMTGELDGKMYAGGVMAPMGTNTDEWIADAANYVRNSFGNSAAVVSRDHVAEVRAANPRKSMWSYSELVSTTPLPMVNYSEWKATASHNAETAGDGINGTGTTRWTSGVPQEPGMWFQLEFPRIVSVAELVVETSIRGQAGVAAMFTGPRGNTIPAISPAAYRVQVSTDGTTWSEPVAEGKGEFPTTVISMKPARAKFVRITQTGTAPNKLGWGIQRIRIFAIQ